MDQLVSRAVFQNLKHLPYCPSVNDSTGSVWFTDTSYENRFPKPFKKLMTTMVIFFSGTGSKITIGYLRINQPGSVNP